MKRIDLELTERARAWLSAFLSRYEPNSVLALSYGPAARWRFVVFTRAQAEKIEETSSLTGEDIYMTNDGFKVCIGETKDAARLAGGILDVANDTVLVAQRAS
jgi:hypothetical protein